MSSESERRLSTEELKRLNQPSKAAPPPMVLLREADWEELLDRLDGLEASVGAQEALLRALTRQVGLLPTQEQTEALARDVAQMREALQQAGKKKEKHSCKWLDWLPDFDLIVVAKWIVLVLLIVAALLGMGYGTATVVSNIRNLFL